MLLRLTGLAFELNHAIDAGHAGEITVDAVKDNIRSGKIFDFLEAQLAGDLDISLFYNDDRAELIAEWRSLADSVDEERKFGVSRDGICLLIAYIVEGIQRRVREVAA